MKKILEKIFIITGLFLAFFGNTFAKNTDLLDKIKGGNQREINIGNNANNFIVQITDSLINIFLVIAVIYFFIIVIKIIVSENAEEESSNFKKGFIWISLGIMVLQLAKVFVKSFVVTENIMSTSSRVPQIGHLLLNNIIKPLTALLETGASFIFILIGIYAFFRLISSNGDDNKAKEGKMTIFYAIVGFIIIKISSFLIKAVYGECKTTTTGIIFTNTCEHTANISKAGGLITTIINWLNSFIGIGIVIMVIYAGLQIIFSKGDEEKLKSGKNTLIYIFIGVGILVMNYLILTFFLKDYIK